MGFNLFEDFEDIKFLLKIKGIHKIEKKKFIRISVFGYVNKIKYSINVSKKSFEEKNVDFLLIGEEGKIHYVLIKDCKTIMYDYTLIVERNLYVAIIYRLLVQKKN